MSFQKNLIEKKIKQTMNKEYELDYTDTFEQDVIYIKSQVTNLY